MIRCGVDMIECERIAAGIERLGERFLNRFFTAGERQDCGDKACRLAARFAAKEAVSKAIGTGIGDIRWLDIEIRSDEDSRKPRLVLRGPGQGTGGRNGLDRVGYQLEPQRCAGDCDCGRQIGGLAVLEILKEAHQLQRDLQVQARAR